MRIEPDNKRVFAYIDGQNLFHALKDAYGYIYPNYDIRKLANTIVSLFNLQGWILKRVYFYTGIPSITDSYHWNHFWIKKLAKMGTSGIYTYARELSHNKEKGIDLRLAIDVIRSARRGEYDICVIFSQDQDFTELAKEIRFISKEDDRWIKICSAFPVSPQYKNNRGIYSTDWIPFDKALYDTCIDPLDYRPRS
jgi:uncharacterized LabA/DUF88 family protein